MGDVISMADFKEQKLQKEVCDVHSEIIKTRDTVQQLISEGCDETEIYHNMVDDLEALGMSEDMAETFVTMIIWGPESV